MWLVNRTRSAKLNQNTSDTSILSFASRFICRYLFVDGIPQIMLLLFFLTLLILFLGHLAVSVVWLNVMKYWVLFCMVSCTITVFSLCIRVWSVCTPSSVEYMDCMFLHRTWTNLKVLNLKKRISLNILDLIQLWQQFGLSSSLVSFSLTDSVLSKWVTSL